MSDLLVKLYGLPDIQPLIDDLQKTGIAIRRGLPYEKHAVIQWVRKEFKQAWASECEVAYCRSPVACFIAVRDGNPIGFACHDIACRNFFGPTGVIESARGKGIGKALLLTTLNAMRADGYAYAIIGDAGPTKFYEQLVGAIIIPDSNPSVFRHTLKDI